MRPYTSDTRARDRFSQYAANESFYNGDPAAQLTVQSTVKRDEVRAVFNYARDILNKHAAATVAGLRSQVVAANPTAQALLDAALARSNDATADFAACLQGAVLGDSAFYITHEDGAVFYRVLHPGDVDVIEWTPAGRPCKVMVQHDCAGSARIETWTNETLTIEEERLDASRRDFRLTNLESPSSNVTTTYSNPYGVIPVVVWPNWPRIGSRWGDSTLEHIKAAARLLNERLDLLMWLVRVQGNPPIKALGVDKATLRTDPGEMWTGPADAKIDLVKLMDAETAGIHHQTIRLLLSIVKELSNTPDIAYGIGNTQLSGRALEMAYMPMIQAATVRRGFMADAVRQRNRVLLRMAEVLTGIDLGGAYDTRVTFAPVVPADRTADRIQDRQDVELGVLSAEAYAGRYQ